MKATLSLNGEDKKATITVVEADTDVLNKFINIALAHFGEIPKPFESKVGHSKPIDVKSGPYMNISAQVSSLPEDIQEWYRQQLKIADSKQEPSFYHTGIKFKNGSPTFRTRYKCPNCTNIGKQYETLDAEDTTCHNCGSIIDIEKVKRFPFPDQFLNYFNSID